MAVGLGHVFGVRLPQNFNSPYKAVDPIDFWRRWHISLSTWLRDYLYIPLGGNRGRQARNLMITMLLGGLWHGAAWLFVFWGGWHGLLLTGYHAAKAPRIGAVDRKTCRPMAQPSGDIFARGHRVGVLPIGRRSRGDLWV